MWPAAMMAKALIDRRRDRGRHDADHVLVLAGAGHFIRPPITPTTVDRNDALIAGGTPDGSARAQRIAWDTTLDFLRSRLRSGA
jgi:BAAT / Acyl-CoA thioester hydrolase C terminal